jgi:hypothetical protein
MSTKFTHRVFFRQLTEAQSDQINRDGWSSEVGKAYLEADGARGDREPKYDGAIKLQLFEMATQLQAESLDEVWAAIQNLDKPWTLHYPKFTFFPRSMATGDIIHDRLADKFYSVASFGFTEVTDEAMINHLKEM